MGIFDNFLGKKDREFGLAENSEDAGLGMPPVDSHSSIDQSDPNLFTTPGTAESNPIGRQPVMPAMPQQPQPDFQSHPLHGTVNPNENPLQKDFEILSSKLDYLKASIEAVNQRLANLEHLVKQEQDKRRW